jgi:hypothetical protein
MTRGRSTVTDNSTEDALNPRILSRRVARASLPVALVLHLALFFLSFAIRPHAWLDDAVRFEQIGRSRLVPYREEPVEYMPIELVIVRVIAGEGADVTVSRIAVLALAGDLMTAAALAYGWGRRACTIYLWVSLSMLFFLFFRFDLVVVASAAWGVALATRGKQRSGGVTLGAAVMTKLWALILIPTLLPERRRTFSWAVATTLAGIATWILVSSIDGPSQVGSFRGAVGWDVSSVVGSAVWAVTGDHSNMESGVERVGFVAPWELAFLLGSLAMLLWLIYRSAWRGNWEIGGGPALAAVAALLVCSPVFGLQYGAWLLPWTAVAASSEHPKERRLAGLSVAVIVLTGMQAVATNLGVAGLAPTAARNIICVLIPILWLVWALPSSGATRSWLPLSSS